MLVPLNENGEPMVQPIRIRPRPIFMNKVPIQINENGESMVQAMPVLMGKGPVQINEIGEPMVQAMPILMGRGPVVEEPLQKDDIIRIQGKPMSVNEPEKAILMKEVAQNQKAILESEKKSESGVVYYIVSLVLLVILLISLFFALRK